MTKNKLMLDSVRASLKARRKLGTSASVQLRKERHASLQRSCATSMVTSSSYTGFTVLDLTAVRGAVVAISMSSMFVWNTMYGSEVIISATNKPNPRRDVIVISGKLSGSSCGRGRTGAGQDIRKCAETGLWSLVMMSACAYTAVHSMSRAIVGSDFHRTRSQ